MSDTDDTEFDDRAAYRRLLDTATDPLFVLTAAGEFELVNQAFLDLLGYDRTAVLGTAVTTVLHDEDERDWELQRNLLATGSGNSESWAARFRTKHGTEVPVDIELSLLHPNTDGLDGVVARVTDLRERQQQEQKLNILNRALRHNIRNRMNVILANATLLQDIDDEGYRTAAERIEDVSNEIINISDKARKAHEHLGVPAAEECQTELVGLVEETVTTFSITYPNATVQMDLPERAVARAPSSFEAALTELLENAVIHHPSGCGPVAIDIELRDGRVAVHVRDECDPIPDSIIDCLDVGEEHPLEHNDGLGLWIVQWVVETVGGTLRFDRRADGRGNEITLTFDAIEDKLMGQ